MWPRIVAGIFIPVGNHYFLASTLQFVAQVCDRLWLVPATDRAFAYITYMSPPHVALVCSGPPQCAATCGWTKWPVCSGPKGVLPACTRRKLTPVLQRILTYSWISNTIYYLCLMVLFTRWMYIQHIVFFFLWEVAGSFVHVASMTLSWGKSLTWHATCWGQ